jgi:hypothetical protein
MSFRNGHSLQAEYEHLKARRARGVLLGLFAGTVLGAFASNDASVSMLAGLITAVLIGIWKSVDVMRVERIIYPGGKR